MLLQLFKNYITPAISPFIKSVRTKTKISPRPNAIRQALELGWTGQAKMKGKRIQVHISEDKSVAPILYRQSGKKIFKALPASVNSELYRLFAPQTGWSTIDAEWVEAEKKLFVYDILKHGDRLLTKTEYLDRRKLFPSLYISPHIKTLQPLLSFDECIETLKSDNELVEGIFFKSPSSFGFLDSSFIKYPKK